MRSSQRNAFTASCHCSGVARSDSKLSAKALYGKRRLERLFYGRSDFLIYLYASFPAHTLKGLDFTYQGTLLWSVLFIDNSMSHIPLHACC